MSITSAPLGQRIISVWALYTVPKPQRAHRRQRWVAISPLGAPSRRSGAAMGSGQSRIAGRINAAKIPVKIPTLSPAHRDLTASPPR